MCSNIEAEYREESERGNLCKFNGFSMIFEVTTLTKNRAHGIVSVRSALQIESLKRFIGVDHCVCECAIWGR
jgi:hypothetical protein